MILRTILLCGLLSSPPQEAIPALAGTLRSESVEERDRATRELIRLGESQGKEVREALAKLLEDRDVEVALRARHIREALDTNDKLRLTCFPLLAGCRWTYLVKGGAEKERTVELGERVQVRVSTCTRPEHNSWELKEVAAWTLKGYEAAPVYVVEEAQGVQIIGTRRVARGHSGILSLMPVAVFQWGKAETWTFCTRTEGEDGRTPMVQVTVERGEPETVKTPAGTFSCTRLMMGSAQIWLSRGIGIVKQVIDAPKGPETWELSAYQTLIEK
jgi:hypothetical protein